MVYKVDLHHYIEQKFTLAITIVGYFFFFFALLTLIKGGAVFFALLFILLGVYFSFSTIGIQIDTKAKVFKYYSKQFFIKKGKWLPLTEYPDIGVLLTDQKQTVYGGSNAQVTTKSRVFKVYLLNVSHREKLFIKEFKTEEKAILFAKDFAGRSGTTYTIFSPEISEATRSRRR